MTGRAAALLLLATAAGCGGGEPCGPPGRYWVTDTALEVEREVDPNATCAPGQRRLVVALTPDGRWVEGAARTALDPDTCELLLAYEDADGLRWTRIGRVRAGAYHGQVLVQGPGCFARLHAIGARLDNGHDPE